METPEFTNNTTEPNQEIIRGIEAYLQSKSTEPHKCRFEKPKSYPERFPITDKKVAWKTPYPEYTPSYFVAEHVIEYDITTHKKGWADPEDITKITHEFRSFEGEIIFDKLGRPLNPKGRTGIEGRGLLGKWGANLGVDALISRINKDTGLFEMIFIERTDNGNRAFPGGFVDTNESTMVARQRELKEECTIDIDLSRAEEVFKGYIDDFRNTDNAWIESAAGYLHLDDTVGNSIVPIKDDDAKTASWIPVDALLINNLNANHGVVALTALIAFYKKNKNISPAVRSQLETIFNSYIK